MNQRVFRSWILAARPKTLTTALIPILVGTALAYAVQGKTQPMLSLFALFSTLMIQIGTNLVNDALDFKKGADTADRIGPRRVTQSGLIQPRLVFRGGIFCFILAIFFALPLVLVGGLPILAIGVASLIAGYAYTGGPYPLAYLGLGDFFVLVFYGWVAVAGVYYLNTGSYSWMSGVAGAQIGFLATVIIAINNFRDSLTDKIAHKKTLAVRFGPQFVRWEILILCLLPFFCGWFWFHQGLYWAAFLPLLLLPLAVSLTQKIRRTEPSAVYNQYFAHGALLHLSFGIFLSLGLILK